LNDNVSVIGTGQNLFDSTHREYASDGIGMTGTLIPRSGGLQPAWRF
jgi:hypothetical protein